MASFKEIDDFFPTRKIPLIILVALQWFILIYWGKLTPLLGEIGYSWDRQSLPLLVRHCLIKLCVLLLLGLEYALLYLLHLLAVGLLRLLPLVILLHWLHVVASTNARVLVKEPTLRGVGQLQLRRRALWKLNFLPLFLGHKVISCDWSRFGPSGRLLLLRLIEGICSWIIENLLTLCYKIALPLLRLLSPDSQCLPAAGLHSPNLISSHILQELHYFLLNGHPILIDLLPYQCQGITSLWFYSVSVAVDWSQRNIRDHFAHNTLQKGNQIIDVEVSQNLLQTSEHGVMDHCCFLCYWGLTRKRTKVLFAISLKKTKSYLLREASRRPSSTKWALIWLILSAPPFKIATRLL